MECGVSRAGFTSLPAQTQMQNSKPVRWLTHWS